MLLAVNLGLGGNFFYNPQILKMWFFLFALIVIGEFMKLGLIFIFCCLVLFFGLVFVDVLGFWCCWIVNIVHKGLLNTKT
jgi:hypothetical protein